MLIESLFKHFSTPRKLLNIQQFLHTFLDLHISNLINVSDQWNINKINLFYTTRVFEYTHLFSANFPTRSARVPIRSPSRCPYARTTINHGGWLTKCQTCVHVHSWRARQLFIAGHFERDIVRANGKTWKLSVASGSFYCAHLPARCCNGTRPECLPRIHVRVHRAHGRNAREGSGQPVLRASFNISVRRVKNHVSSRKLLRPIVVVRVRSRMCSIPCWT